jgi:hypothetical protein
MKAAFNATEETNPKYCATHKLEDMVNVVNNISPFTQAEKNVFINKTGLFWNNESVPICAVCKQVDDIKQNGFVDGQLPMRICSKNPTIQPWGELCLNCWEKDLGKLGEGVGQYYIPLVNYDKEEKEVKTALRYLAAESPHPDMSNFVYAGFMQFIGFDEELIKSDKNGLIAKKEALKIQYPELFQYFAS